MSPWPLRRPAVERCGHPLADVVLSAVGPVARAGVVEADDVTANAEHHTLVVGQCTLGGDDGLAKVTVCVGATQLAVLDSPAGRRCCGSTGGGGRVDAATVLVDPAHA